MPLASTACVTRTLGALVVAVCVTAAAADARAQSRFDAIEQSGVGGVPGLRIITVRDTVLKTCYLVFLGESRTPAARPRVPFSDLEQARVARDAKLAELQQGFDQERGAIGALPGTIMPNPMKFEWQASAAQLDFALQAIERQFAQLEQELDRIAEASRSAMTAVPVACAPAPGRTSP